MDVLGIVRRNWLEVFAALSALSGLYFGAMRPDTTLIMMSFLAFAASLRLIQLEEEQAANTAAN